MNRSSALEYLTIEKLRFLLAALVVLLIAIIFMIMGVEPLRLIEVYMILFEYFLRKGCVE